MLIDQDMCPTIPSADTAYRLMRGDGSAVPNLIRDMVGRAALVGIGVALAGGSRDEAIRYGIAGALSIEAFVLAYAAVRVFGQKAEPAAQSSSQATATS
jgi:hypothetical protein